MADFKLKPAYVTKAPTIQVDAGLEIGSHRFQLVVVDENGNRSKPDEIVVTIFRPTIE